MKFELDTSNYSEADRDERTLVLAVGKDSFVLRDKKSGYYLVMGTDLESERAEINIDTLSGYGNAGIRLEENNSLSNVKTWRIVRQC